jgi:RNA polymerase sigma-70 factor (ECF subfamily)
VTDETLASLAAGGDRGAFEELVNRHRAGVYRLARSVTGCHADADDAAQEAFLRIYRALADYDPGRPFKAWMMRIAYNASLTIRRAARGRPIRPAGDELPDTPDPGASPQQRVEEAEHEAALSRALDGLPEDLRATLVLRAREGMSYRQIAQAMGCRIGTVMSRLSRARRRIVAGLAGCRGGGLP